MLFIVSLLASREGPVRVHCNFEVSATVRALPLRLPVFCDTDVCRSVNYQQGLCPVFGSIVKIKFLLKWQPYLPSLV